MRTRLQYGEHPYMCASIISAALDDTEPTRGHVDLVCSQQ